MGVSVVSLAVLSSHAQYEVGMKRYEWGYEWACLW
jgi:hypothetical protein